MSKCVNGVCLDGLCYCDDGFGGKGCDLPGKRGNSVSPLDNFLNLFLSLFFSLD